MSHSKAQSIIAVGIGLLAVAIMIIVYSLSQPLVAVKNSDIQAGDISIASSDSGTVSQSAVVSYPLNINTCTAEELMTISGIGEAKASAIIEYRSYLGGYTSVEQIKEIKGIGQSYYEKIAPYLTV